MIGRTLMLVLLVEYIMLVIVFLFEKRFALALYWTGATLLHSAVMIGMK